MSKIQHVQEQAADGKGQTCSLNPKQLPRVELLQELSVEPAGLDGKMVQLPFLVTLGQDVLLNRFLTYKAVNVDFACLPYAMTPVLCLRRYRKGL